MGWVLLTYQLPADSSRARVAVWREVRRRGALHLQQAVVAFPDTAEFREHVERFAEVVAEVGGETLAVGGQPLGTSDGDRLVERWNAARDDEYRELIGKCEAFLGEIEHEFEIEKFTDAELEEEEAELEKLRRWHERIASRDVHRASAGYDAAQAIERAEAALGRFSEAVFERTGPR
jgi:hypothetical protein